MFFKAKYHCSINTCTIGIFQSILKGGDPKQLVISGRVRNNKIVEAWGNIYDEYLKLYGIPKSYVQYCEKKVQAGEAFLESMQKGNEWKRAIYNLINIEAESLISNEQSEEFEKVLAYVSKQIGFRIDPNTMTVREFYGYLKLAQNGE